jgi:hypothetical protein
MSLLKSLSRYAAMGISAAAFSRHGEERAIARVSNHTRAAILRDAAKTPLLRMTGHANARQVGQHRHQSRIVMRGPARRIPEPRTSAQLSGRINHHNVAKTFDFFEFNGSSFSNRRIC